MALTGRAAILAAREGGETIKANKIATPVGSVPAKFSPRLNLKLRALGLPLPLRGFAMFPRQFSASKCRLELPSAGLIVMSGQAESRLAPAATSSVLCRLSSVL